MLIKFVQKRIAHFFIIQFFFIKWRASIRCNPEKGQHGQILFPSPNCEHNLGVLVVINCVDASVRSDEKRLNISL